MRTLLLSASAVLAFTTTVVAADLPIAPPPAAPIARAPLFTWTGFYAGVNAGVGFDRSEERSVFVPPEAFPPPPPVTPAEPAQPTPPPAPPPEEDPILTFRNEDGTGFVGGGQIGYNIQFGSFVVGIEADLQYADLGGRAVTIVTPEVAGFVPVRRSHQVDWFGTVRGRAGFAFDRVLVYATGGFAYGGTDDGNDPFSNEDDISTGWTVGGGVEWALPVNWFGSSAVTFGVEGLYVSLERERSDFIGFFNDEPLTFPGAGGDDETEFGLVRAKLNFKF